MTVPDDEQTTTFCPLCNYRTELHKPWLKTAQPPRELLDCPNYGIAAYTIKNMPPTSVDLLWESHSVPTSLLIGEEFWMATQLLPKLLWIALALANAESAEDIVFVAHQNHNIVKAIFREVSVDRATTLKPPDLPSRRKAAEVNSPPPPPREN